MASTSVIDNAPSKCLAAHRVRGRLGRVDWASFWAGLGEVMKNAGPLVVGVVGIVATYLAGARSVTEAGAREIRARKRQIYGEYAAEAGVYVDYYVAFSATFSGANTEKPQKLSRALKSSTYPFPDAPTSAQQERLSRAEAQALLIVGPNIRPKLIRLSTELKKLRLETMARDQDSATLFTHTKDTYDAYRRVVELLQADAQT